MENASRKITLMISDDDIRRQLDLVIGEDRMSAEIALRHLLDDFDFDEEELLMAHRLSMDDLSAVSIGGSFHFRKGLEHEFL